MAATFRTTRRHERLAAIVAAYGDLADDIASTRGETYAEWGMSWVAGGGHRDDVAAAFAQLGPDVSDPDWFAIVDAASDKLYRIAAWNERAASALLATAPLPDEPF